MVLEFFLYLIPDRNCVRVFFEMKSPVMNLMIVLLDVKSTRRNDIIVSFIIRTHLDFYYYFFVFFLTRRCH